MEAQWNGIKASCNNTFLDPILNNISQVIKVESYLKIPLASFLTQHLLSVVMNCKIFVKQYKFDKFECFVTGINGKVNRNVRQSILIEHIPYMIWTGNLHPKFNELTKKDDFSHYLRACKEEHCIAVQSVCEFPGNFMHAMCLCDASCGPNNEFPASSTDWWSRH